MLQFYSRASLCQFTVYESVHRKTFSCYFIIFKINLISLRWLNSQCEHSYITLPFPQIGLYRFGSD